MPRCASTTKSSERFRPLISSVRFPQLANVMPTETLFYVVIIPFIIFFGSFAGVMYPNKDFLHPTSECQQGHNQECYLSKS